MTQRPRRFPQLLLFALLLPLVSATAAPLAMDAFWPTAGTEKVGQQMAQRQARPVGLYNVSSELPVRVVGGFESERVSAGGQEALLAFVDTHPAQFQVRSGELELLHSGELLGKRYLTARQLVDGRPVLGTRVILRVSSDGEVLLWGADVLPEADSYVWRGGLGGEASAQTLAAQLSLKQWQQRLTRQVWVREGRELRAAWLVGLESSDPLARPVGLVDASSAALLGLYDELATESLQGSIEGPMYPYNQHDSTVTVTHPFQDLQLGAQSVRSDTNGHYQLDGLSTGQQLTATGSLSGQWVNVRYDNGANGSFTADLVAPATTDFLWIAGTDARSDELNMYHHVNWIHDWYKRLDPGFTGLDFAMLVQVGMTGSWAENAFSSGDMMGFGAGGMTYNNFALNADVIYHEYTHSVTWAIYPSGVLPYSGQSGAMNEAWSDYFPSTISGNPGMARGIYTNSATNAMRNLDNNNSYPENFAGEVHHDGLIIGGAMWHTREAINDSAYTDSIVHYARYGYANTFEGYLLELLTADDDNGDLSDGTRNDAAIYAQFGRHGIGPGADPNLVLSDLEFSSTTAHHMLPVGGGSFSGNVMNDVYLFPPSATGVTLQFSSRDGRISFSSSELELADLGPGQSVSFGPLDYEVAAMTGAAYEWVYVDLIANGGDWSSRDSLRVALGDPDVLLVDDDPQTSYLSWLHDRYERAGSAAASLRSADQAVTAADLADYTVVEWISGDAETSLSLAEATLLVDYLDGGGQLILAGQYLAPEVAGHAELAQRVGLSGATASPEEYGGTGEPGEPLSSGLIFLAGGSGGANNQQMAYALEPAADARPLYNWFQGSGVAGIYRDLPGEGGKAVLFGFGSEALSGYSTASEPVEIIAPLLADFGLDYAAVPDDLGELPRGFELAPVYPNPFNPTATVAFRLPQRGQVSLTVHNLLGQEVARLVEGVRDAGEHRIALDLRDSASGIYLIRLLSPEGSLTRRAVLLK